MKLTGTPPRDACLLFLSKNNKFRIFVYKEYNLKKFFTILLTIIYLFLTAGLPITVHYCHGQIEEIKFLSKSVKCCEDLAMPGIKCCDIEIKTDCCSNEYYVFQLDIDEEIVSFDTSNKFLFANVTNNLVDDNTIAITIEYITYQFCDLPPPKNQPIWLLNCNFSFYG